jgi:hypothetical protein
MATSNLTINIKAKDTASGKINKVKKTTGSLKSSALKLGAAFGAAFGVVKIKQFITESIRLYGVQEKAEARLTASINNLKVLGKTFQGAEQSAEFLIWDLKEYAKALQKTTTFGDEQIISAQAMLGTFQLTGNEIMNLTPALLDMAASTEKTSGQVADLNDLAIAMGKAMTTGAGALGRYGITLTDVQKEQFNLATGVEKTELLVKILTDNFGGAAEELRNTTAGALTAAANDWGDFKETVGQLLAPMLASIAGWISGVAQELQWQMGLIKEMWEEDWYGIRTTIETAWAWIQENVFPTIMALVALFAEIMVLIKKAWEGDWLAIRTALTTAWELIKGVVTMALGILRGIIEVAMGLLRGDWDMVWEGFKTILISIWEGIASTLGTIIDGIIESIKSLLKWTRDAIAELATLGMAETETFNPAPRQLKDIPMEFSMPRNAAGGPVFGGMPSIVGEKGPEVFVPSNSGKIIPNHALGGVVVNLYNSIISSAEVAEEYADIITQKLQLSTKVV